MLDCGVNLVNVEAADGGATALSSQLTWGGLPNVIFWTDSTNYLQWGV